VKVLVTGATGLLGKACVRVLSEQHEVMGLARHQPIKEMKGLSSFDICDISDLHAVNRVFNKRKPDGVVHTAAIADVDQCERRPDQAQCVNVQGTKHIAQATHESGSRLISMSTDQVFDGTLDRPYREDDLTHPVNVYGRSKVEAEQIVLKYNQKGLSIRTSWLYSKEGSNFIRKVLKDSQELSECPFVSDKFATPTDVDDLAEALRGLFSEKGSHGEATCGILHLTHSGGCSWYEYAEEILSAYGRSDVKLLGIPMSELGLYAPRPMRTVLDCSQYARWTGNAMRSWQDAVRECVSVMQKEGKV
jgi:dTDP-4-dehydrorhamnose reductase